MTKPQWRKPAGFLVSGACGRRWWLPFEAVRQDYMAFLMEADGKSKKAAAAQVDDDLPFVETWFNEQYIWQEVDRDGLLLTPAPLAKYKHALDFYRINIGGPQDRYQTLFSVPKAVRELQGKKQ